ncbi:geranylgeranylglycerol-phosphate geranylgeranyltransferase [Aequorivita echinoideorum]|uniref:Geranylgeranylglycerol-phosphate geranylgeranyltransferase n=1 Tax=Aequorivita echinoideorum TaxID=1549647 RepID=A0ABS5S0M5_9FLAO|nr:geranylgeranylglycerol-phosphate geranylgeranyltransferase [Aequorivita echinoideorum]MBT0606771.1 geranylgeranylglycerol-phosphate geranylgeranyltransferase [Aequorivita echinoideorum]
MWSRKQKHFLLKFFSLFSIVRGYNILIIVIAQYLTSIFILAPDLPVRQVLLDVNLLMLVLASSSAIASGYIINSFYDSEKDLINRPQKTMLDKLVSQHTKLSAYFILNFLSVIFASYVSFRAVLFFSIYIFALWFYSHKLKKYPFIGNITAAILAVIPFFAIFIHYSNFDLVIFGHATFLFLLISMRELVKDLENITGDLALGYRTIPVVYGEKVSKQMLSALILLTLVPTILLITKFSEEIGYMDFYFFGSIAALGVFMIILWNSKKKIHYVVLHNTLKFIIVAGVFSIVLIHPSLILSRFA